MAFHKRCICVRHFTQGTSSPLKAFWTERCTSPPPSTIHRLFAQKRPAEAWLMRKTVTRHMTGCVQSWSGHIQTTKKEEKKKGKKKNAESHSWAAIQRRVSIEHMCLLFGCLAACCEMIRDETANMNAYTLHQGREEEKAERTERLSPKPHNMDIVSNFARS